MKAHEGDDPAPVALASDRKSTSAPGRDMGKATPVRSPDTQRKRKPPSRLGKGPTPGSWKPGQSGNYKGGPRSGLALATTIRERIDPNKVLDIVVGFIDDDKIPAADKLGVLLPWLHAGFLKPPTTSALHVTGDGEKLDGARLLACLSDSALAELADAHDRLGLGRGGEESSPIDTDEAPDSEPDLRFPRPHVHDDDSW